MNINPDAPVVVLREIKILASQEIVWEVLTDVNNWSNWSSVLKKTKMEEPLALKSQFRWHFIGMNITSTIEEFEVLKKLGWKGKSFGGFAIHNFFLSPNNANETILKSEESMEGWGVILFAKMLQKNLEKGSDIWFKELKAECEKRQSNS